MEVQPGQTPLPRPAACGRTLALSCKSEPGGQNAKLILSQYFFLIALMPNLLLKQALLLDNVS